MSGSVRPTDELKVFKVVDLSADRFEDELRQIRRSVVYSRKVVHESILPCEGAFVESSAGDRAHVYLQFDLQLGGNLRHWASSIDRPITRLIEVMAHVSYALSALHQAGVCHRDIKPDNIVMSSLENNAIPKITDFEFSKFLSGTGVQSHKTIKSVGTDGYMAPEIRNGIPERLSENTPEALEGWKCCDVYSLGTTAVDVILFRCKLNAGPSKSKFKTELERIDPKDFAKGFDGIDGKAVIEYLDLTLSKEDRPHPQRMFPTSSASENVASVTEQ
jgi:serine/threonine protein kinase